MGTAAPTAPDPRTLTTPTFCPGIACDFFWRIRPTPRPVLPPIPLLPNRNKP
ncbi:hypothetical protein SAMN05443668_107260 [Cryptosporangium aurantiacum]|uniref:Uncharacterized protein n=2 Tax=Cryptosporangium aurantiacum TaxID=134849 RepID=A0A1M7TX48_9ACTN|nr:hypothetical protein SAMN05443668_107260 [Cryptosporangium aurantiacum]